MKDNEYPVYVPFSAVISIFGNRVIAKVECQYCGGKMEINLKCPHTNTSKLTDDWIKYRVLQVARKRHNCALKISQWGDPAIARKVGPDILRGYEKLKEKEWKIKKQYAS